MTLLWLAFFCSGVAGLSYELTWMRYLAQLFGASTPAVSATVSIFFLGLALGAALGGKWFDRSRRPLLQYAALEVSIGLCALCVPFLFQLAESSLTLQLRQGNEHPFLLLAISAVILLIPTTLLGATFPAMAAVVRNLANPTFSTGFFYGFNTLGAVVGCLLVSFVLLPSLGLHTTTWVMAAMNGFIALLLAGLSFWMQRREGGVIVPVPPCEAGEAHHSSAPLPMLSRRMALVLAGSSGFLAIGIEVLWTRALALSVFSDRYVFALVLAAYLVGIGVGAVAVGWFFRRRPAYRTHLLALYMAVGLGCVSTLFFFPRLMPWCSKLIHDGWLHSWAAAMTWIGGVAVLTMLPATFAMGAALPLLIGLATDGTNDASETAGRIYAINTIGGVIGSFLVTYTLLPQWGLSKTLFLLALGYVGLALLMSLRTPERLWRQSAVVIGCVGLFAVVLDMQPEVNPMRHRQRSTTLYYHDAPSATWAVYQSADGHRSLHINNHRGFRNTQPHIVQMQFRLGHVSTMLHPKPQRLLVLGFGTGASLAAISQHPISAIDCVALHGEKVVKLSRYFSQANLQMLWRHPLHKRTKVNLLSGDGRRMLMRPGAAYDLIVGDLYLPRDPGLGTLYSLEHFQAAKKRLTQKGVFVAWLPLAHLGPQEVATITRTFMKVFPQAQGWVASWSVKEPVLGLVGRRDDGRIRVPVRMEQRLERWLELSIQAYERKAPLLRQMRQATSAPVSARTEGRDNPRYLLTPAMLKKLSQGAPLNRLQRPVLEFMAPRSQMQARLHFSSLARQNILSFSRLRSLLHTPWSQTVQTSISRQAN